MSDSYAIPWTIAGQTPLSMGFSRKEYWSGLPFPSPENLPDLKIEPRSRTLQADFTISEPPGKLFKLGNLFLGGTIYFLFFFPHGIKQSNTKITIKRKERNKNTDNLQINWEWFSFKLVHILTTDVFPFRNWSFKGFLTTDYQKKKLFCFSLLTES